MTTTSRARDAGHRGQRVRSRLSAREREHVVGLPAPPPLHLAGSRRGADGRPRTIAPVVVCGWIAVWLLSDVGGRMARGRGRPARRDAPSEHRNRHPAVASTACSRTRSGAGRDPRQPPLHGRARHAPSRQPLKDGRTATAAEDHDPQRLPLAVTIRRRHRGQCTRRFPAATALRGNIEADPDGEPDRVSEFPAAGARSRTGRLADWPDGALKLAPGLSYRCATLTPWQSGGSARSPCPPTLMLR